MPGYDVSGHNLGTIMRCLILVMGAIPGVLMAQPGVAEFLEKPSEPANIGTRIQNGSGQKPELTGPAHPTLRIQTAVPSASAAPDHATPIFPAVIVSA
jgi:hypothetical protein